MSNVETRTTPEEFELFKSEFKKWQVKFGLIGWNVYFKHEPLDDCFADITPNLTGMVATVRLNSALPEKDISHINIKADAKHEALHLLIARLEYNGRARYVTPDEVYESAEELVRKLEVLTESL